MTNHPPHLPNKTCSVKLRNNFFNIRIFIFYIIITFIASVTGALVTFSWLIPSYNTSDFYLFNYSNNNVNQNNLDANILNRRFDYNTVKIFDNTKKVYDNFFSQDAFLGRAVLLSSNGWAVFYDEDFNYNKIKNWSIIDHKGLEHNIEKTILDSENNFIYLKLSGESFHVISFANINNLKKGDNVWYPNNDFLIKATIIKNKKVLEEPYWSAQKPSLFEINEVDYSSNIIFDDQGKIYGFLNSDFTIKPVWKIEKDIPEILENNSISELENDFKGFFVNQEKTDNSESEIKEKINGFYVNNIKNYIGENYVKKGDIILEINGEKINPENLAYKIINLGENYTIKVWRNGEKIILDF